MFLAIQIAAVLIVASLDAGAQPGSVARADADHPQVEGDGYSGVIFPVPPFNPKAYRADGSWTPSASDVRAFESRLRSTLAAAIRDPSSIVVSRCRPGESGGWCKEFERRRKEEIKTVLPGLSRYRRQYAGVTSGGRKTLVANFFPGVPPKGHDWHPGWRHEWVNVLGGGTGYWGISFDVQEKRFHDFYANSPR
jgi:hypothetical protein